VANQATIKTFAEFLAGTLSGYIETLDVYGRILGLSSVYLEGGYFDFLEGSSLESDGSVELSADSIDLSGDVESGTFVGTSESSFGVSGELTSFSDITVVADSFQNTGTIISDGTFDVETGTWTSDGDIEVGLDSIILEDSASQSGVFIGKGDIAKSK